mgnify:CR=1 FL=1
MIIMWPFLGKRIPCLKKIKSISGFWFIRGKTSILWKTGSMMWISKLFQEISENKSLIQSHISKTFWDISTKNGSTNTTKTDNTRSTTFSQGSRKSILLTQTTTEESDKYNGTHSNNDNFINSHNSKKK